MAGLARLVSLPSSVLLWCFLLWCLLACDAVVSLALVSCSLLVSPLLHRASLAPLLHRQVQQLSCITCVHLPKPREDELEKRERRGGRVVEVVFVALVSGVWCV